MIEKEKLLKQLKDSGYEQSFIDWLRSRYTNKQLRILIEDDKTFDIITRVAKQTGKRRQS